MATDRLERTLREALRERLDPEIGPDPQWAGSPAARRVGQLGVRRRWPVRELAVAAVLGGALGAGLLAGAPKQPVRQANGWVAYAAIQQVPGGDPDTDIWFAAPAREPRRIAGSDTDAVDQACPAFSPDGKRLAYGTVEGLWSATGSEVATWPAYRSAELVVADVAEDGGVNIRQTFEVGDGVPLPCPVWSPDGDHLAFGVPLTSPINPHRTGTGSAVWVVRPADGHVAVIADVLATDLDWAPDGATLAFAGGVDTSAGDWVDDAQIRLYEVSTGTIRTFADTVGSRHLAWSPDGRRIAFTRDEAIHLIDVETGAQEVLANRYDAVHGIGPVWSPDGKTIAYQRRITGSAERHEVVLVSLDARSAPTAPADEVVLPAERMRTDGSRLGLYPWRVSWSPDGTYLLYVAWTYSGPTPASEETWAVAVPTDPKAPVVVLAKDVLGYDSADSMRVQFQVWQPRADGSAIAPEAGDSGAGGSR